MEKEKEKEWEKEEPKEEKQFLNLSKGSVDQLSEDWPEEEVLKESQQQSTTKLETFSEHSLKMLFVMLSPTQNMPEEKLSLF
ncbi:hypothetical protein M0813_08861 [Anaeramoeba flamelloides]|uniref:Uncharacterized protein n=1 Tax=Anaeramoeba flamelloides TaxID=1746091 RepID=A0ABQ8XB78_9EUKA|nr:hypothetical protein M0813_08861 [Anaeramoeba flamelloides]